MPFEFEKLAIPEVVHITPKQFADDRGVFTELFKQSEFVKNGVAGEFKQVNQSISKKGVLRALHYQNPPHAQAKLVTVTRGEGFDVAVDIRKGSPTYGQWVGQLLSAEKKDMLYVPVGFAHGFCALSEIADLLYFCTGEYSLESEGGVVWNDPAIGITWPIEQPILAARDAAFPTLEKAHNLFTL